MGSWIGRYRKINKNFDWKGGKLRREIKPRNGKGKRGGDNRNGEKGYKKRTVIFLFTRATVPLLVDK